MLLPPLALWLAVVTTAVCGVAWALLQKRGRAAVEAHRVAATGPRHNEITAICVTNHSQGQPNETAVPFEEMIDISSKHEFFQPARSCSMELGFGQLQYTRAERGYHT